MALEYAPALGLGRDWFPGCVWNPWRFAGMNEIVGAEAGVIQRGGEGFVDGLMGVEFAEVVVHGAERLRRGAGVAQNEFGLGRASARVARAARRPDLQRMT